MTSDVGRNCNYFNMEPHKTTETTKSTYNNQKTNQSLGNETHTLDTKNKHFDTIRVICVT